MMQTLIWSISFKGQRKKAALKKGQKKTWEKLSKTLQKQNICICRSHKSFIDAVTIVHAKFTWHSCVRNASLIFEQRMGERCCTLYLMQLLSWRLFHFCCGRKALCLLLKLSYVQASRIVLSLYFIINNSLNLLILFSQGPWSLPGLSWLVYSTPTAIFTLI